MAGIVHQGPNPVVSMLPAAPEVDVLPEDAVVDLVNSGTGAEDVEEALMSLDFGLEESVVDVPSIEAIGSRMILN